MKPSMKISWNSVTRFSNNNLNSICSYVNYHVGMDTEKKLFFCYNLPLRLSYETLGTTIEVWNLTLQSSTPICYSREKYTQVLQTKTQTNLNKRLTSEITPNTSKWVANCQKPFPTNYIHKYTSFHKTRSKCISTLSPN